MSTDADFIVIGAGSAGCIAAAELARRSVGRVLLLEAGPSDSHPLVKMPHGLAWLMGSKRDWRFKSTSQKGLGGRQLNVHRGRILGGSGSINSMVWFRGRRDDFDSWNVKGWTWPDVTPRLCVAGVSGLWAADASVMPAVTSANTNAPSMMIRYRAAKFISEDAG